MREKFEYQKGVIRTDNVMAKKKRKDKTTKSIYKTLPRTLDLEHHKHNLKPR
jgi:hypothetical protein